MPRSEDQHSAPDDVLVGASEPVAPAPDPDAELTAHEADATIVDTRQAIAVAAGAVQQQFDTPAGGVRKLEGAAFEEEVERRANILVGDRCLQLGRLDEARNAYEWAGATEKLVALGEHCIANGLLDEARKAYAAALVKIPAEELVFCGNRCLAVGLLDKAREAYAAAGVEIPAEKLVAFGDRSSERMEIGDAVAAYAAAGAMEKLVTLGERCLVQGQFDQAQMAYAAAGAEMPAEKLVICGKLCVEAKRFDEALGAYTAAGAMGRLLDLGDRYLDGEKSERAYQAYAAAERIRLKQEQASDAT